MDAPIQARLQLTGEIHLGFGGGAPALLTRVEVATEGTFDAPLAPFRLTLEGRHGELRKLAHASPAIASLLALHADVPDEAEGQIRLVASDGHRAAIAAALAGQDVPPQDLLEHPAWLGAVLTLTGYRAESIGTITRG